MRNDRSKMLAHEKEWRLLFRLSIPAAIAMITMALYNIVDTIFVGQAVGPLGIAGLTIVLPIHMLVLAIGQTFGIGGSSIISRALGAKDYHKANKTLGNLFSLAVSFGIILTILCYFFVDQLLYVFGAREAVIPFAYDYFMIIVLGTPLLTFAMVSNNIARSEGNAKVAMTAMLMSSIVNIILDPIFIFGFEMGVQGAAIATVIAQVCTVVYLIWYFASGKSMLRFARKNLRLDKSILTETFAIGASSFARQIAGTVMAGIFNNSVMAYGGATSLAIFGIINRVLMFVGMPMFGFVQGFMPIAGFAYGAKNFKRVVKIFKLAVFYTTVIGIFGFLMILIFAESVISVFSSEADLLIQGERAIRIAILALPIVGFQMISSGYFQSLGKAVPAFILAIMRQVLFMIPLVLILPIYWDIDGIWASFPLADFLAGILTFILILPQLLKLKKFQTEVELTALPVSS